MKKKKNYLDFVPVCAPGYSWKLNEKKLVEIEVQNKGFYNWLAQKFFKRPKVSYISLDEYGSFVWQQMDGQRTIYDISFLVKERYGEGKYRNSQDFHYDADKRASKHQSPGQVAAHNALYDHLH